jgi:hypothetical protein
MGWLDRLMDVFTRRSTKPVGAGHPPADTEPATGSEPLSTELESGYGADTPNVVPPAGAPPTPPPGQVPAEPPAGGAPAGTPPAEPPLTDAPPTEPAGPDAPPADAPPEAR